MPLTESIATLLPIVQSAFNYLYYTSSRIMSATPEPTVPVEPGAATGAGVEATQEVQAADTLPQSGVTEQEAQDEDQQEEEAPRPRLAFPPRAVEEQVAAHAAEPPADEEEAEDVDSDEDGLADLVRADEQRGAHASGSGSGSGSDSEEEEAYVPGTETSAAKIPKFKKRKGAKTGDVGTNGEKKTKKSQKSQSQAVVQDDEDADEEDLGPQLDEGTRESWTTSDHGAILVRIGVAEALQYDVWRSKSV